MTGPVTLYPPAPPLISPGADQIKLWQIREILTEKLEHFERKGEIKKQTNTQMPKWKNRDQPSLTVRNSSRKGKGLSQKCMITCSGARRIWQRVGFNGGSWGETPSRRRLRGCGGVVPRSQQIFAVFTWKTLILAHYFQWKRASSECSPYGQCKNIFAVFV